MSFPNYREGQVVLIDKPLNWTSFDVVNKMRYALKRLYPELKRFKVGHAGTLDPLATGLLVICTGKKTKTIPELTGKDKTYTGTITLGGTTPSYDLETAIDQTFPTDHITPQAIQSAAEQLTGEQLQTPPVFSAKKIDGVRAYEKARKGEHVEIKKHLITVHQFDITSIRENEVDFEISCSKGTYIRSLAHDFGKLLGSGSHLSALRRTKVGEFDVATAQNVDDFVAQIQGEIERLKAAGER